MLGEVNADSAPVLMADQVRFAFTGALACQVDQALLNAKTVLCAALDPHRQLCGTPGVSARTARPAAACAAMAAIDSTLQLAPVALKHFLLTYPDARLIDVRESHEHAVGAARTVHGRGVDNVPLSRLPHTLAEWLRGAHGPRVFFCRSGKRSATAAHCLHRLGYQNVWYVAGALALVTGQ